MNPPASDEEIAVPPEHCDCQNEITYAFVIVGASGYLSKRKLYPTLWNLYKNGLLPLNTYIFGFARSKLTIKELQCRLQETLAVEENELSKLEDFWRINVYLDGQYNSNESFAQLEEEFTKICKSMQLHRIYYLAIPPSVLEEATTCIQNSCHGCNGEYRIVVEKPFGKDYNSSVQLTLHLASLFSESQIYRIDHDLGKEMIQNLMTLRFANRIFGPTWNRENIAFVVVTYKDPVGIETRNEYFDEYGIIRDMLQTHLIQMLSLVGMEKPCSIRPDDIRDEKVKVLKCIPPVQLNDTAIGQYVASADNSHSSYLHNEGVAPDSLTPTFAACILRIENERWDGVPFVLKCGKALNERKAEVRVQYKDVTADIFKGKPNANELVIKVQPGEALYVKLMVKTPGMEFEMAETELDLTYGTRSSQISLPGPYENLILDIFRQSQMHFMRSDELNESWRIFTPLLEQLENQKVKPYEYAFGSRGPIEADELLLKNGFRYSGT